MTRDKLERSVFAGMPCSGHIVVGLDDLSTELLVIRNVQLSLVIEESVEFFPLKKVVDQPAGAFFAKHFESLGNFNFAIGAVSNFLFEHRGFSEGSSSKRGKALGIED
jgi:hypothetical protein